MVRVPAPTLSIEYLNVNTHNATRSTPGPLAAAERRTPQAAPAGRSTQGHGQPRISQPPGGPYDNI